MPEGRDEVGKGEEGEGWRVKESRAYFHREMDLQPKIKNTPL